MLFIYSSWMLEIMGTAFCKLNTREIFVLLTFAEIMGLRSPITPEPQIIIILKMARIHWAMDSMRGSPQSKLAGEPRAWSQHVNPDMRTPIKLCI